MNRRIAIASCEPLLPDGDHGDLPLVAALRSRGIEVSVHAWFNTAIDWSAFDATVIRSTWDYTARRQDFLDWLDQVPRLHNPASVVAPNTDKTYLRDLSGAGLPVVPTLFAGPFESVSLPSQGEFVIKPTVGAGSRGAGRFHAEQPGELERAQAHAAALQSAGLTVMVQPYLSGVDTAGEAALIYLDGVFSHSVRKGRMLGAGDQHGVDGPALYIEENISAREPTEDERDVAERILRHLTAAAGTPLLYARIDLLPSDAGPVLVEAELTEPSLFLDHADGAGERLAAALVDRIG